MAPSDCQVSDLNGRLYSIRDWRGRIGRTTRVIGACIGYDGGVILLLGLLAVVWLHGGVLFFWDEALPLSPGRDLYFSYFTWHQLDNFGYPQLPLPNLPYYAYFYVTSSLGIGVSTSETLLVYLLFSSSGLGMLSLIRYLMPQPKTRVESLVPIAGACVYMVNFYVAMFLLSELWPSWLTYSLAPFAMLALLRGWKSSLKGPLDIVSLIEITFIVQLMSPGFQETPYFAWSLLLFIVVGVDWGIRYRRQVPKLGIQKWLRFPSAALLAVVVSGLWWEYSLVGSASFALDSVTTFGSNSHLLTAIIAENTTSNPHPFQYLLNILALYPFPSPTIGANYYPWQGVYVNPGSPMVIVGAIFATCVFLPLAVSKKSRFPILGSVALYATITVIVSFGLKSVNPLNPWLTGGLLRVGGFAPGLLYAFRIQFIGYPLAFLYAMGFASFTGTVARVCGRRVTPSRSGSRIVSSGRRVRAIARKSRELNGIPLISVALVVVVAIYPWYMWTPSATQVLQPSAAGPTVPSVTKFPSYFTSLNRFLGSQTGGGQTLILPEGYSMNGMLFNNSAFADDADASLLSGSPMVYHANPLDTNYWGIESLIYGPLLNGTQLANYLANLNIRFILLNTLFYGGLIYPYYNLTYLTHFLQNQTGIRLVRDFGPLPLFENSEWAGMIAVARELPSLTSPVYPNGSTELASTSGSVPSVTWVNAYPSVSSLSVSGGKILYNYESYSPGINPVVFYSNETPTDINVSRYPYLSINFSSSANAFFFVYANFSLERANGTEFVDGLLEAISPSPSIAQSNPGYYSSESNQLLVFVLRPEFVGQPIPAPGATTVKLNRLYLGIYLSNAQSGDSGSVQLNSLTLSPSPPLFSPSYYLASQVRASSEAVLSCPSTMSGGPMSAKLVSASERSPTNYIVQISNPLGSSFVLVFRQSFDSRWEAVYEVGGGVVGMHCEVDGYANGWVISTPGNYSLELIYTPQTTYDLLVVVSIVANSSITTMAVWGLFRRHRLVCA